jgi:hypothetical protein
MRAAATPLRRHPVAHGRAIREPVSFSLEARKLGSSSIIIRMSAISKLAVEATDNGMLDPEMATGILRVKSAAAFFSVSLKRAARRVN